MEAGMFKPLRNKAYRSLFGAQVFSDLGNWLDFIAIQVIVAYHWGLGEAAIASVIIVMGIPWVIIGPLASVFVDKLPKKTFMISCLSLRILFVAGLFFAPNLYVLLLFVFLKATVSALYDPARQSAIRHTVPEEELPEAVTLSQLSVNTMKIVGPALGGGMIALYGVKSPFVFEAAGFLIAILLLLTLPKIETEDNLLEPQKTSYFKELSEGINHIFSSRILKAAIILSSIAFFIIFLYDGLFIFVAQDLGFDQSEFGLLVSSVGFGSVVGALFLGRWTDWKHKPIHLMASASVISGLLILGIGTGVMGLFELPKMLWMAGAFLLGILASAEGVPYGYVLQSETPRKMMGRVSAAAMSLQTFSMLVAPAAGALLAKWIGVSGVLMGAGIATFFMGTITLIIRLKQTSGKAELNNFGS
ncbi:MFS transporter [Mesobacillus selenatarsenatis]|uniref:Major facilitator superfamily (MFS) transporter n=1 Tax=Mesobacillus selenatarsenatis (strain DSM 18680 / JCM 14380 / FERM P-15431 / SF-1) TaxID=1321606 RepID=A0A0A8X3E7_MESS1|nr:MFS transporter [Mesobacillus selenatarsenatis]GAM13557.1 major facilitator superfamily (MFS) transporter [Mesobacillus selenatarsenatis SF-1]